MVFLASVLLYSLIHPEFNQLNSETLRIQISNIEKVKGHILIAIYDQEGGFPEAGGALKGKTIKVDHQPNMQVEINDLSYGQYAIAVFHDLNNNQKLDKNFLGIPTEPYGFSNNPKVKWSAPTFQDAHFEFSPQQTTLKIELKRWKQQ